MPIENRGSQYNKKNMPRAGAYIARITNYLDPTYMGNLEVSLESGIGSDPETRGETFPVIYCSPFYGVTNVRHEGNDPSNFNDVQKSYGFWMVPPDIGTRVLVMFVDGQPHGYWVGCISDQFQNHMVPGIAASQDVYLTPEQEIKYGTNNLPVGEFLKKTKKERGFNPNREKKPIHPFADRLLTQGLLLDNVRGVTSSSARREVPSSVYGFSTPGPLDPNGRKGEIGYDRKLLTPVSRLGGSQLVMDDGDAGGENELVRIRTRTGHQILLHNTNDLIYVANSKGTAWIELTSNGKIDVFAQDSVSIHSQQDFNFRADRDINMEAGRNINTRAGKNSETNIAGFYNLIIDDYAKIAIRNNKDETIGQSYNLSVLNSYSLYSQVKLAMTSDGKIDILAEDDIRQSTGGDLHFGAAGRSYTSASQIHLNGPAADSALQGELASPPPELPLYSLPNRDASAEWSNGKFYHTEDIISIMQRVPTHEPWDQHESVNPLQFSPQSTDVSLQSRASSGIPDTAPRVKPAAKPAAAAGSCGTEESAVINNPTSRKGITLLRDAAVRLGLTSTDSVNSLLAICAVESIFGRITVESTNYSADGLLVTFPSVLNGDRELAEQYASKPIEIANFVYGPDSPIGKILGNTQPGDGAQYVGRGYIQITGRYNYSKIGKLLRQYGLVSSDTALLDNPRLLEDPKLGAESAVAFLLDRVKVPQTDPAYFEKALSAVGGAAKLKKRKYYACFTARSSG